MIFIDSNVPMYLVGADHPHKTDAQRILERLILSGESLVTDVEVFQEILHHYVAIDRRDAIPPAWEVLSSLADEVLSIDVADVTIAVSDGDGGEELIERYRGAPESGCHESRPSQSDLEATMAG